MKNKKIIRQRGHKTHGWGSKKKHRGAGSRGGRGRAGIKKHKKLMFMKKNSGSKSGVSKKRFSRPRKKRFKSLYQRSMKKAQRSINISDALRMAGKRKEISLKELGYEKLLARGEVSQPLTVKAAAFSDRARQKIEAAGGKALKE